MFLCAACAKAQTAIEPIDILSMTNLEQCKTSIIGLKKMNGFIYKQWWFVETSGRTNGLPVVLKANGKTVRYKAIQISIDCLNRNDFDHVSEIQTQTERMNIDDTRKLGLQLCNALEIDSKDFEKWCDNVGNRWLDMPLFATGGFNDPRTGKFVGFQTLRGYDDRPWFIQITIQDR